MHERGINLHTIVQSHNQVTNAGYHKYPVTRVGFICVLWLKKTPNDQQAAASFVENGTEPFPCNVGFSVFEFTKYGVSSLSIRNQARHGTVGRLLQM
jgi:hypothetical protein